MKTLDINNLPKVGYCISETLRDEQIKINLTKVKSRVIPIDETTDEPIAIVCFGPSLNKTWKQLKKFKKIMTCSGAHKFLLEKGIVPTYHCDLEPREHKIKLIGEPQKETEYLIASTVHPKYLDALSGFNVKLWHIFATSEEGQRVLPRGEWAITGGSSIGLRCMTLARFLGYKNLHIFGMDGSFGESGTHTTEHPNAPKDSYDLEYKGVTYKTTPSMAFCANETWKELDNMFDVTAKFYGEGLVQSMAKDYTPNHSKGNQLIAFTKPELISDEYRKLNNKLHQDNPTYGMGGGKHSDTVIKLAKTLITPENQFVRVLDYGCGKGMLAKSLPFSINEYDPAVQGKDESPSPADLVVCSDVLEHIEPDKLNFVLDDLKRVTKQIGYFVISTRKAVKTYANGSNAHLIVQGKDWWEKKIAKFFSIGTIIEKGDELYAVVSPKVAPKSTEQVIDVDFEGVSVKFNVPNDTIKWRVDTIFKKEPITIDWIKSFKEGETMIDVGANMGGYSMLAAAKGVKVLAFEPEAENYALLQKNISLNNANIISYCAAITDRAKLDKLYLSQRGAGGSCHSFGEQHGKTIQGCIGLALDELDVHADHIKIDVDGQEPKVIEGALKLLSNGVKSVLIEVNTNIPAHNEMVKKIQSLGFEYDQSQVDSAIRKDGNFKGCAEYLFTKNVKPKVDGKPYPYEIINNFFPKKKYNSIIKNMKGLKYETLEKARGTSGYPERFVCTPKGKFWDGFLKELLNGDLKSDVCETFGLNPSDYMEDVLLIKDKAGYKIGVHRDRLDKVVTLLIYLAKDGKSTHAGTGIYVPKEKGFSCPIGKHYGFDKFDKLETVPYLPNTAFMFLNTDKSFHGVEPCDVERNVLLYNLNKKK